MTFLLPLFAVMANASNSDDARTHAIRAAYIQTGTEEYVNTLVKRVDTKYIPEYVKDNGTVAALLLQCTIRHEISWKWSF